MYKIFEELCVKNAVTPYKVSKATGIATSTLSDWKKGISTPKQDKLKKIADYFEVSLEYLMTGKEPQVDHLYSDENAEFLIEVTKMAKDKDFVERMTKYMSLMNEDKKSVDDMIDFMYAKEQKKSDN